MDDCRSSESGDREQAQELLYVTAQAVKAFLGAFDPLAHGLGDLIRSGYSVRVFVTAEDQARPGHPITYLIEMNQESGDIAQEWSPEDEAFLRDLSSRVAPHDESGRMDGQVPE